MVDLNMDLEGEEKRDTRFHKGLMIGGGLLLVGFIALAVWLVARQPEIQAKKSALAQLKSELDGSHAQAMMVKDKIVDLTKQLDEYKAQIDAGLVSDKAAAIQAYNKVAEEQRTTRELYQKITDEYNAKLADFRAKGGE